MVSVDEGETTLCIGGLPHFLTQEDVREMADEYGTAVTVVGPFKSKRKAGCIAYVVFRERKAMELMIEALNGTSIKGISSPHRLWLRKHERRIREPEVAPPLPPPPFTSSSTSGSSSVQSSALLKHEVQFVGSEVKPSEMPFLAPAIYPPSGFADDSFHFRLTPRPGVNPGENLEATYSVERSGFDQRKDATIDRESGQFSSFDNRNSRESGSGECLSPGAISNLSTAELDDLTEHLRRTIVVAHGSVVDKPRQKLLLRFENMETELKYMVRRQTRLVQNCSGVVDAKLVEKCTEINQTIAENL